METVASIRRVILAGQKRDVSINLNICCSDASCQTSGQVTVN